MNFKVSVVLLHSLAVILPISQYSVKPFGVLASILDANETQSKIRRISTIMTTATIVSETCNDQFCNNSINETKTSNNSKEYASWYKHEQYDRLKSTSILYGLIKIASKRPQTNKCYQELNQIYHGIHRKEIWAIKGNFLTQTKKLVNVQSVYTWNWKVYLNKSLFTSA